MNVDSVAGKLIKAGIPIKGVHKTEEPEVQDDTIFVTEKIHVQVSSYGDTYMHVLHELADGTFMFYPESLSIDNVVSNIRHAMLEDKS